MKSIPSFLAENDGNPLFWDGVADKIGVFCLDTPRAVAWLRDAGARGEIADVTGRLSGEKIEIDFPARRTGGCLRERAAGERSAKAALSTTKLPDGAEPLPSGDRPVPVGDSKLRLLKVSALRGCVRAGEIHSGDLLMVFGPDGAVLRSVRLRPLFSRVSSHSEQLHTLSGSAGSAGSRPVSSLRVLLFSLRWRKAAGVKVLREPWLPYPYTKRECFIPMRDGVRLYTAIYEPYGPGLTSASSASVIPGPDRESPAAAGNSPFGSSASGLTPPPLWGGPPASVPRVARPSEGVPAAAPIILMRSPYPVGTYGYGGVGDLSDRIRCFTDRGYIIVEQNVRGTYMSEGVFEDVRTVTALPDQVSSVIPDPDRVSPASAAAGKLCAKDGLSPSKLPSGAEQRPATGSAAESSSPADPAGSVPPTDEVTDAYDTIEWLLSNTVNNGNVGIYGVSYPGFYATLAALCGHPALKAVSPQAPVTDWWMGDDAHRRGALMLGDMYGFGGSFFRLKGNPTPDSRDQLVPIPEDSDFYEYFRGKPISELLQPFLGEGDSAGSELPLKGFADIVSHPNYDEFWQERNPLRHLRSVKPAMMVVGGLYDAEDAWGAEHTWKALRELSPETETYGVLGPWTHGGWRKDPDFLERIEVPFFEYYLEGKGEKPAWRELYIPTGETTASLQAACTSTKPLSPKVERPATQGENLAPGKQFFADLPGFADLPHGAGERSAKASLYPSELPAGAEQHSFSIHPLPSPASPLEFPITQGSYISDPANPVPYMDIKSAHRNKAYMWADQRFASERPDVLTQVLAGPLDSELWAVGPVKVHLRIAATPAPAIDSRTAQPTPSAPDGFPVAAGNDASAPAAPEAPAAPDSAPSAPSAPAPPALDADLIVKLIDQAPDGTQNLVRAGIFPARWRNSAAELEALSSGRTVAPPATPATPTAASSAPCSALNAPVPLIPGEPAGLNFETIGVCHRFAPGHSIVLQIQSSLFPLVAMNPQTFLENPYSATAKDYRPVKVKILEGSSVTVISKK